MHDPPWLQDHVGPQYRVVQNLPLPDNTIEPRDITDRSLPPAALEPLGTSNVQHGMKEIDKF